MAPGARIAVFDLDGTLLNPFTGIKAALLRALAEINCAPIDDATIGLFIGSPLQDSFAKYLKMSESDVDVAVAAFRHHFGAGLMFDNEIYEGMEKVLIQLAARDVVLVVATSKPEALAERILEHAELRDYFDVVSGATADGAVRSKVDVINRALVQVGSVESADIAVIGDREFDMVGARKFDARAIGVEWGFGSREELLGAGADAIVASPQELESVLVSMGF